MSTVGNVNYPNPSTTNCCGNANAHYYSPNSLYWIELNSNHFPDLLIVYYPIKVFGVLVFLVDQFPYGRDPRFRLFGIHLRGCGFRHAGEN